VLPDVQVDPLLYGLRRELGLGSIDPGHVRAGECLPERFTLGIALNSEPSGGVGKDRRESLRRVRRVVPQKVVVGGHRIEPIQAPSPPRCCAIAMLTRSYDRARGRPSGCFQGFGHEPPYGASASRTSPSSAAAPCVARLLRSRVPDVYIGVIQRVPPDVLDRRNCP
jgi:hypothetical protein